MHFEIPFGVARSAAIPLIFASRISFRTFSIVSSTRAWVRPVMTTDAPSRASARAIANPIPAVDPVTRVFFPSNCKFIASFFCGCVEKLLHPNAFEAEISFRKEHRSGDLCGAQAFKPVFHVTGHVIRDFKRPNRGLDDSLFRFGACGAPFRWPLSVPVH